MALLREVYTVVCWSASSRPLPAQAFTRDMAVCTCGCILNVSSMSAYTRYIRVVPRSSSRGSAV